MTEPTAGEAPPGGLAPGTDVGPYRVVGLLGRGGMGVVYEARHVRVGQRVALKVLAPARRAEVGDSAVRRFLAEVDVLSRLEHPGLVRILDCGDTPAHGPWLAMELVTGEVLRAQLERAAGAPLPIAGALRTVRRIASAVAAIHRAGIVHRDLKPENVMVTPDDEVSGGARIKLLDFGIAKLLGSDVRHTTEGMVLGTAGYMAPEQCAGSRDVDDKADVYAVGVIGFELVTGARPFTGAAPDVMRQHLFAEPPLARLPVTLPPELVELFRLMLAKEPSRRPGIAQVVERLRGFEAALAGAPEDEPAAGFGATLPAAAIAAAGASTLAPAVAVGSGGASTLAPVVRPPPVGQRRRWPALAAGGAALALVVVGGGLALRPRATPRARAALPGMVAIPGARFQLGSTRAELTDACAALPGGCLPEEQPQLDRELPAHAVEVSAFQLDAREVSNREYAAFLNVMASMIGVRDDRDERYPRFVFEYSSSLDLYDLYRAGGIVRDPDKPLGAQYAARPAMAELPVVQVTWDGASRYCHHVGKRLPTEAEWELAARGPERRQFPWGDAPPRCDGVVFGRGDARGCPAAAATFAPVGTSTQDVTATGLHDLGGNAAEWVEDQFLGPYGDCGACKDPRARDDSISLADDFRIYRGGSMPTVAWATRTTTRSRSKRTASLEAVGFRCAHR